MNLLLCFPVFSKAAPWGDENHFILTPNLSVKVAVTRKKKGGDDCILPLLHLLVIVWFMI